MGEGGQDLNPLQIIMKASIENVRPEFPKNCSPLLRTLIQRCWDPKPEFRPSLDDILKQLDYMENSESTDESDSTLPLDEVL